MHHTLPPAALMALHQQVGGGAPPPLPYTLPPLSHGLLSSLAGGAVNLQPVCAVRSVDVAADVSAIRPDGSVPVRVELLLTDGDTERWVALAPECVTGNDDLEGAVVRLHECVLALAWRCVQSCCVRLTLTPRWPRRYERRPVCAPSILVRALSVLCTQASLSRERHGRMPGYTRNAHDEAYVGAPLSSGVLLELAAGRRRVAEVHVAPVVQLSRVWQLLGSHCLASDGLHTVAMRVSGALLARLFASGSVAAREHCVLLLRTFTFEFDPALRRCVLTAMTAGIVGMAAAPLGAPVALETLGLPPLAPLPALAPPPALLVAVDDPLKQELRGAEARGDTASLLAALARSVTPGGGNALRAALACESLAYVASDAPVGVASAQAGSLAALAALLRSHGRDAAVVRAAACAAARVARALRGLADTPHQRGEADVLSELVAALRRHGAADAGVAQHAAAALRNLMDRSAPGAAAAVRGGAVDATLAALDKHGAHDGVQSACCALLSQLAFGSTTESVCHSLVAPAQAALVATLVTRMRVCGVSGDGRAKAAQAVMQHLFAVVNGRVSAADAAMAALLAEEAAEEERATAAAAARKKSRKKQGRKAQAAAEGAAPAAGAPAEEDGGGAAGGAGGSGGGGSEEEEADGGAEGQPSAAAERRRRRAATKATRRAGGDASGAGGSGGGGGGGASGSSRDAPAEPPSRSAAAIAVAAHAPPVVAPLPPLPAPPAPPAPHAPPPQPQQQQQQQHFHPAAAGAAAPPATLAAALEALARAEAVTQCVVCMDAQRSLLLLPCRHLALCGAPACLAMLGAPPLCPVCRKRVEQRLDVFL
jgi:hypothetical protein